MLARPLLLVEPMLRLNNLRIANESFWKSGHLPTLLGSFVYFDTSFMIWVLLGALGNYVANDFGLSPAQKGLMTALPLLAGSVLRLILGVVADRIGPKKTGVMGMALIMRPLLGGWLWADSLEKIFLVGLLLGVAGASFAVALPMASRWYPPQHQGLAMGIAGAGNSGTLFATLFAPRLAESFGWHAVFGLAMIPLLFAMIVFTVFAKDPPGARATRGSSEYLSLLREPDAYRFCLFYGVTFGGFSGLLSFMPIFLHDQYSVSMVVAGNLTSLCVLSGSFMRPLGGWIADRLGGVRVLIGLFGLISLSLAAMVQLPSLTVAILFLVFLLGLMGLGNGAIFQLVPQRFGGRMGAMTGLVGAAGGLGGFMFPVVLGWFKQSYGSFGMGFALFAALSVLALINLLTARRRWVGLWLADGGLAVETAGND